VDVVQLDHAITVQFIGVEFGDSRRCRRIRQLLPKSATIVASVDRVLVAVFGGRSSARLWTQPSDIGEVRRYLVSHYLRWLLPTTRRQVPVSKNRFHAADICRVSHLQSRARHL